MGDGVDQCVGTSEQKKQEYIYIYIIMSTIGNQFYPNIYS